MPDDNLKSMAKQSAKPLRVAVLVSGSGSNLQVLINAAQAGGLHGLRHKARGGLDQLGLLGNQGQIA